MDSQEGTEEPILLIIQEIMNVRRYTVKPWRSVHPAIRGAEGSPRDRRLRSGRSVILPPEASDPRRTLIPYTYAGALDYRRQIPDAALLIALQVATERQDDRGVRLLTQERGRRNRRRIVRGLGKEARL
jgi:hypothetical protein